MASFPLHPPVGCERRRYLQNTQNATSKSVLISFSDRLLFLLLFISAASLQVFFVSSSSVSGGRWHDQGLPICGRCWVVAVVVAVELKGD